MSITLSRSEHATAWRLITSTSSRDSNIADVIVTHVLPRLRAEPTLLDVGGRPTDGVGHPNHSDAIVIWRGQSVHPEPTCCEASAAC